MSNIFEGVGRILRSEELMAGFHIACIVISIILVIYLMIQICLNTNVLSRFIIVGGAIAYGIMIIFDCNTIKNTKDFIVGAVTLGLLADIIIDVIFYIIKESKKSKKSKE